MLERHATQFATSRATWRSLLALGVVATAIIGTGSLSANSGARLTVNVPGFGLSMGPGLIVLPPGFQCRVLADESTIYSDGTPRPGDADGMGAFPGPNNTTILCVNHELPRLTALDRKGFLVPPLTWCPLLGDWAILG